MSGITEAETKTFRDGHTTLAGMVRTYNERARAINMLRHLDGVVSLGRVLAANWDPLLANELTWRSTEAETNKVSTFDNLRQIDREIEANRASASIDQNRAAARARVDAADADLRRAFDQARANKWRGDVLMFLQIAQTSLQTWRYIDSLLSSST